jgi:hypothetical protein
VKRIREYKNGQIARWGDRVTKEDFKFQIANFKLKTSGEKDTSNSDCRVRIAEWKKQIRESTNEG